jgi:hypothetical protein
MSKSRKPGGSAKKDVSLVRSSAAEYLTFVAASGTRDERTIRTGMPIGAGEIGRA